MGRKSNDQNHISSSPRRKHINNDDTTNELYRKRLRSWKQTSTQLKSNYISSLSSMTNDEVIPLHKSTIYTYPINLNNTYPNTLSSTILSESLTTESAFYCPSLSYTSIEKMGDLNNNNHMTTLNIKNTKRTNSTSSCESLSSQFSHIKTSEILHNPNHEKNMSTIQSSTNQLQLTFSIFTDHQNSKKRTRLSINDSIITNHRSLNSPLLVDDNTIDINQLDPQESLSLSINNNESIINKSNSMETAIKMVQPIVDIIFNAFENQLKDVQAKTFQSSSNCSSISPLTNSPLQQIYPSVMIPYHPITQPTRPVVLNAVNFNIQLTTKQPTINSIEKQNFNDKYLILDTFNKNDYLQSISMTELKNKVISCILSNNFITDHQTNNGNQRIKRRLKRIIQLAVFGVSVLCGYLLL